MGGGLDRPPLDWPGDTSRARLMDGIAIAGAGAFLLLPLGAVLLEGVAAVLGMPALVWEAALRSIIVALGSTALAVGLAVPVAIFAARGRGWVETLAALSISVSPLVMGTGLFLILFPVADPVALALPVTGFVNALVALPFILRALIPELRRARRRRGGWPMRWA